MAEAILWATLIIASSSLVFAVIAFRQVMLTSENVNGLVERGHKVLSKVPKDITKVVTPQFVGDTITHVITKDIKNSDGSNVNVHGVVNGYITEYGPVFKEIFKEQLPTIVTAVLNHENSPPPGPGGPQNPGQALVAQRGGAWGSGGLKAATKVAKAAKKVPFTAKIGEAVETVRDLVALKGTIIELKEEIFPNKGDNGGEQQVSSADQGQPAWGPPY